MTATIAGKTRAQKRSRWEEVFAAGDRSALPVLVEVLPAFRCSDSTALLRRLTGWLPDSRVVGPLLELLRAPPHGFVGAGSQSFWLLVLESIERSADTSVLETLQAEARGLEAALPSWWVDRHHDYDDDEWQGLEIFLHEQVGAVVARLEAARDAGQLAEPSEEGTPKQGDARNAKELLAAVYHHPEHLQLRAVLADRLLELGDPRGELISIQLLESPTPAQTRQCGRLLREHGQKWIGPLRHGLRKNSVVFRNGFLAEASLKETPTHQQRKLIDAEEWATVEALDVRGWREGMHLPLIGSVNMRSLRKVDGLRSVASLTAAGCERWSSASVTCDLGERERGELVALEDLSRLSALEHLGIECEYQSASDMESFWTSPLAIHLRSLSVVCDQIRDYVALWKDLDFDSLTLLPGGSDDSWGWAVTLTRRDEGTKASWFFHWRSRISGQEEYLRLSRFMRRLATTPVAELEIRTHKRHPPDAHALAKLTSASKRWGKIEPTLVH